MRLSFYYLLISGPGGGRERSPHATRLRFLLSFDFWIVEISAALEDAMMLLFLLSFDFWV